MNTRFVGPCELNCPEKCTVPEGITVAVVPAPRHRWMDVMVCPKDGCGRALLIVEAKELKVDHTGQECRMDANQECKTHVHQKED